jgi:hypothetical protein
MAQVNPLPLTPSMLADAVAVPPAQPSVQVHLDYHRPASHVAFELFGIALANVLVAWLCYECFYGISLARDGGSSLGSLLTWLFVAAAFSGYVLADFGSGCVHFLFDRFFTLETPLMGKNFVHPFRLHHSDPKQITRHGFIETNGNNCLAACPALLLLAWIPFDYTVPWQLFFVATIVFGAIGTFATNQFHKWAHEADPPRVVAWLQDRHVILPRDHHQLHHTHPYNIHYCITTGWLNGILLKLHFWLFLEWLGQRVFHMDMYTEATPWERVPGSPAFTEHTEMAQMGASKAARAYAA